MDKTYDEIQAMMFCDRVREIERMIDNNLDGIIFEDLSVEQFDLISNSMNVVNDIICMIIKNQQN